MRKSAFICYSHQDSAALEALKAHLKPHLHDNPMDIWDDNAIRPGGAWRTEINRALQVARVAIILLSPDFLASEFIQTVELPRLLEGARKDGLNVLWVAVRPCAYDTSPLAEYKSLSDPKLPLSTRTPHEREAEWVRIAEKIADALSELGNNPEANLASLVRGFGLLSGNREGAQCGCAVLVSADSVLTTKHALATYTQPGESGLKFRPNMSMVVDFRQECQDNSPDACRVTEILAVHGDFAALRIGYPQLYRCASADSLLPWLTYTRKDPASARACKDGQSCTRCRYAVVQDWPANYRS